MRDSRLGVLDVNKTYYDEAISAIEKTEGKMSLDAKRKALLEAVSSSEAMRAYSAKRTPVIDLFVRANMIALDFFKLESLRGAEMPEFIIQGARPRIPVNFIADWGGQAQMIYTDTQGIASFPLGLVASDIVKTPKRSLVQGRVDASEEVNREIAYNLSKKLDDMAWTALNSAFGSFNDTVWILDEKIKNAPTTNDLDFASDCEGKLTKDFYIGIVDHFARLGKQIRKVYIPAVRIVDHMDWVSVSGTDVGAGDTVHPEVQRKIWQSGGLNLGASWIPEIVPTNMLEGEDGDVYCFVQTAEPTGIYYKKPELDMTVTDDRDPYFYESHTTQTASFVIPAPYRTRIARVKIGEDAGEGE